MDTKVSIKCSCGSDKFEMPNDPPKSSDIIKCARCGRTGRYGEVMEKAKQKILGDVQKELKKTLSKLNKR